MWELFFRTFSFNWLRHLHIRVYVCCDIAQNPQDHANREFKATTTYNNTPKLFVIVNRIKRTPVVGFEESRHFDRVCTDHIACKF